jgi:Domain of unknown function (DUF6456)
MIDLGHIPPRQLSLLRALARRGAHVARIDGAWRLMKSCRSGARPAAVLDDPLVASCASIGAIAEQAGHWTLTPMGRMSMKRLMSTPKRVPAIKTRPLPRRTSEQEDVLQWLRRHKGRDGRPLIGAEEYTAAERLRTDYEQALMRPRITSSWSVTAALNRERMATAGGAVGPQLAEPLLEACCQQIKIGLIERQRGWPQRSGKLMLQTALRTLAIHYGLLPPDDRGWIRHVEIRHWGADDYRPALE